MQGFYAPEATRIKASRNEFSAKKSNRMNALNGRPIHVKLPEFSTRLSKDKVQDQDEETDGIRAPFELQLPKSNEERWNIHIPMTITRLSIDSEGSNRISTEKRLIRLSVESDFDRPFPQSHKIVLMDPVEDIFFHWSLHLTPFTFKSLMTQQKWKFPQMAGNGFTETFRRFAALIRQCGNDVLRKHAT